MFTPQVWHVGQRALRPLHQKTESTWVRSREKRHGSPKQVPSLLLPAPGHGWAAQRSGGAGHALLLPAHCPTSLGAPARTNQGSPTSTAQTPVNLELKQKPFYRGPAGTPLSPEEPGATPRLCSAALGEVAMQHHGWAGRGARPRCSLCGWTSGVGSVLRGEHGVVCTHGGKKPRRKQARRARAWPPGRARGL